MDTVEIPRAALGQALVRALPELPVPVIIIGGIYSGLITAIEAASGPALHIPDGFLSTPVSVGGWVLAAVAMQLIAVGFLVAGEAGDRALGIVTPIGLTLLWLSAIMTLYTGWDYFRAGLRHMMDE